MLGNLSKVQASRVMGLDCSTKSIAFCIFYNRRPERWGKLILVGDDIYDRAGDANLKIEALFRRYPVDYIAIESAVFVASPQVAIQLAYVYGSIIGELKRRGAKVTTTTPTEWQNFIGNKVLTKAEKEALKVEFPGRSASWYKNRGREIRKQRTMDFFNKKWAMNLTDDDVGDSCGISYHGYYKLTKR